MEYFANKKVEDDVDEHGLPKDPSSWVPGWIVVSNNQNGEDQLRGEGEWFGKEYHDWTPNIDYVYMSGKELTQLSNICQLYITEFDMLFLDNFEEEEMKPEFVARAIEIAEEEQRKGGDEIKMLALKN